MTNRIQIDIIRDVEGNAGNVEGNSGNVEGCSGNVESYSGNVEGCSGNMESCSGMALTITSLLAGTMVYSQKNPRLLSDEDSIMKMNWELLFGDNFLTGLNGFHVQWYQVMMALRKRLEKSFLYTALAHYRTNLQHGTQHNHIEDLGVLHLHGLLHGIQTVDLNVCAGGRIDDAVAVVDEDATRLQLRLELLE